jgi:hypothetical protein
MITLGPVEVAILKALAARWFTLEELQIELGPELTPGAIESALKYLRRKSMVASYGKTMGRELFNRTPQGVSALSEQKRPSLLGGS